MTFTERRKNALAALKHHERSTGTKIPKVLYDFWKDDPFRFDQRVLPAGAMKLADWGDGPLPLRLTLPAWEPQTAEFGKDWEESKNYLPLFQSKDSRLFLVGLRHPKCPVFWYDEEVLRQEGVAQVSSSLAAFLKLSAAAPEEAAVEDTVPEEVWEFAPVKERAQAPAEPAAKTGKHSVPKPRIPEGDYFILEAEANVGYRVESQTYPREFDAIRRGRDFTPWTRTKGQFLLTVDPGVEISEDIPDLIRKDSFLFASSILRDGLLSLKSSALQFLPIQLTSRPVKRFRHDYFVLSVVPAQDVLDAKASGAVYNTILPTAVDRVKRVVIDPKKLMPGYEVFRIKGFEGPTIVSRRVAEALARQDFWGLKFKSLNQPTG